MHYLIDGYNLIGKSQTISLSDINKEDQCITLLMNRSHGKKDRFTLVFDGKGILNNYTSRRKVGNVQSIFTSRDETADDYMIRFIQKNRHQTGLMIISSDNSILSAAKKNKIKYIKSEDFIASYHQIPSIKTKQKPLSKEEVDAWLDEFNKESSS